jgi:hypothetical protein
MEHKIELQKGDLPKKLPKNSEIQEVRFGILALRSIKQSRKNTSRVAETTQQQNTMKQFQQQFENMLKEKRRKGKTNLTV